MSNVTQRIHELAARRHKLWGRAWHDWTADTEARISYLSRLIEEAYEDRRKERANEEGAGAMGERRRVRGLPRPRRTQPAGLHADQPPAAGNTAVDRKRLG